MFYGAAPRRREKRKDALIYRTMTSQARLIGPDRSGTEESFSGTLLAYTKDTVCDYWLIAKASIPIDSLT